MPPTDLADRAEVRRAPGTIIMKSVRSTAARAIRRDEERRLTQTARAARILLQAGKSTPWFGPRCDAGVSLGVGF